MEFFENATWVTVWITAAVGALCYLFSVFDRTRRLDVVLKEIEIYDKWKDEEIAGSAPDLKRDIDMRITRLVTNEPKAANFAFAAFEMIVAVSNWVQGQRVLAALCAIAAALFAAIPYIPQWFKEREIRRDRRY